MTDLFQRDRSVITRHINNIFHECELEEKSNVHFLHIANSDKPVKLYSLDVIISVGYRVRSLRGTQFRQWANRILKDYLLHGYAISQRFERLEYRMAKTEEKIDFVLRTSLPPIEGVLFNGKIFDAYVIVADIIQSAKKRIVVIDNYADYSVLVQLDKRNPSVTATIFTATFNVQIKQDIERHNDQYAPINLRFYNKSHDRFLIIDNTVYHVGASFKDLGRKLFAFSKLDSITGDELIAGIEES
ncbi:MAG: virulence RhuM family protein [Muribaculaceae bacterium]|nr:virulence RhuM family protein [Muribaculaceae bacterium]